MKIPSSSIFNTEKSKEYLLFFLAVILCLVWFKNYLFVGDGPTPLFCNYYDGLKNYFTFNRYITTPNQGASYFYFEDYLHPYGEYIQFLDNTPVLSVPLKYLVTHFPQLESSTFIIYHGYIVLLFALSILFTYKVLRLLKINTLWAFIAALSMSLISPLNIFD